MANDLQSQGRTRSGDKWLVYHCANKNDKAGKDVFQKKKKNCCNHRCPDPVYLNTLFLIIYLRVIKTLICRREMSLIRSTSFGFAQNTIDDFQNTVLNSQWHCLRKMPHNW